MKNHCVNVREKIYNRIETGFLTAITCELDISDPVPDVLTIKECASDGVTGRQMRVRVVDVDKPHGVKDGFCLVTFFHKPTIQRIKSEIIDPLNDPNEDEDEKEMSLDAGLDIIKLFLNHGLMSDIMETCADYAKYVDEEADHPELTFNGSVPLDGVLTQCAKHVKENNYNIPAYKIMDIDD